MLLRPLEKPSALGVAVGREFRNQNESTLWCAAISIHLSIVLGALTLL